GHPPCHRARCRRYRKGDVMEAFEIWFSSKYYSHQFAKAGPDSYRNAFVQDMYEAFRAGRQSAMEP
ncbi:hypothetical protein, partial [Achromobacter xylosoxidans]|uniref:hypothetical protein n=1 Tax=Alcaligenes xylosoxydans xylosoxydans TaxID=85698 RepID=UPI001F12AE25